jgi:hypothetical protein
MVKPGDAVVGPTEAFVANGPREKLYVSVTGGWRTRSEIQDLAKELIEWLCEVAEDPQP